METEAHKKAICTNLRGMAPEPMTITSDAGYEVTVGGENHLYRKAADFIEALTLDLWGPYVNAVGTVWRHEKSGGVYVIVGSCKLEATNEPAYLYRSIKRKVGTVWARSRQEFLDGRFTLLADTEELL